MIVEKVNTTTGDVVTIYESPEIKFTAKTLELPGTMITLNGDLYEFRECKPSDVATDDVTIDTPKPVPEPEPELELAE